MVFVLVSDGTIVGDLLVEDGHTVRMVKGEPR